MAYTIDWMPGHERRMLDVVFTGDITIDEVADYSDQVMRYFDEGTPPVHIYMDISAVGKIPTRMTQLKNALRFSNNPALGWTMIVGGSAFLNVISSVVVQITGTRSRPFTSREEAFAFITQEDQTLLTER